jgi:hypothetical protein
MAHNTISLLALLALGAMAGCQKGPNIVKVQGRVTLDGEPVPLATVEFIPANGRPSEATTDDDGHYSLKYTQRKAGALVGTHQVRISTWREVHLGDGEYETHKETLPAKYNYKSELTFDVEPGKANFADFDLESGGPIIPAPH